MENNKIKNNKTEKINNLEKKQVVFFCATTPYVMIHKIALEFKKKGYETVLISVSQRDKWDIEWYKNGFDKIICTNFQLQKPTPKNSLNMLKRTPHLIKALYEMKKLKPYVVFGVARPNSITAKAIKFFKKYPFIYFPYDISAQQNADLETAFKRGLKKFEIEAERYCFENADGILHKGAPEGLDFLKGRTMLGENLKMAPLVINFLPYHSNEFAVPLNRDKLSKKDGFLHFVYVGGLYLDNKSLKFYQDLFKKLTNQKIHVHIYAKTQHLSKEEDQKNLSPLVKFFENDKYFHIEYAVDPRKLIYEISKYDFGIDINFFGDTEAYIYLRFATGNKTASYLEAGLPCFYNKKCLFIDKILKNYGLNFGVGSLDDFNNFNEKYKKMNHKKLEENIGRAREDFNIAKHFPRLENFVKQVVARKAQIYD